MAVSIREYARQKGVSDTAIRKMISAGKIVKGLVRENGVPRIDIEEADKEYSLYEANAGRGRKKDSDDKTSSSLHHRLDRVQKQPEASKPIQQQTPHPE